MKTTKVYHAPGYPIDPEKEKRRAVENLSDYTCTIIPPEHQMLKSQIEDLIFGRWAMENFERETH